MKTYKVVKIKGATAYERGVQYGQQAKTEIDIAVAFYKKKFEKKFTWSQIIEYAQKFEKVSTEFYPEAVEEMRGIADGSGYTIEEIIAVNELRTEWVVFKKAGTYLPKTNLEILLKVFYFP